MVLWIAVGAGGLFAWMAVRIGFFATWIMFFNLLLSAHMAIFLTPVIIPNVPAITETPYGHALVLVCVATATLLISYAACYACLSGRLSIEFPRVFETLAAGVLGFLSGFLAWSLVSLTICLSPLAEMEALRPLGFETKSQDTNTAFLCWWCDRFHGMVGSSESELTSREIVEMLRDEARPRAPAASDAGATGSGASSPNPKAAETGASSKAPLDDWPATPAQDADKGKAKDKAGDTETDKATDADKAMDTDKAEDTGRTKDTDEAGEADKPRGTDKARARRKTRAADTDEATPAP